MAEPPEPDLDEKFSLYPMEGEEVLEVLLNPQEDDDAAEGDEADPTGC